MTSVLLYFADCCAIVTERVFFSAKVYVGQIYGKRMERGVGEMARLGVCRRGAGGRGGGRGA